MQLLTPVWITLILLNSRGITSLSNQTDKVSPNSTETNNGSEEASTNGTEVESNFSPQGRSFQDDMIDTVATKGFELAGILGNKGLEMVSSLGSQGLSHAWDTAVMLGKHIFDKIYEVVTGANTTALYDKGVETAGDFGSFLFQKGKGVVAFMAKTILDNENATMSKIDRVLSYILQVED